MATAPAPPHIDSSALDSLRNVIRGELVLPAAEDFKKYTTIFNATIIANSSLLVRPLDAQDVSEVVKFCNRHGLTLSVKAGGYGTHGWAVSGTIILDLTLINSVSLSLPTPNHTPPSFNIPTSPPSKQSSHSSFSSDSSHGTKRSRGDAFGSNGSASAGTSSRGETSGSGSGSGSGSDGRKRPNRITDETGWGASSSRRVDERGDDSSPEDLEQQDSPPSMETNLSNATLPTPTLQSFLPHTTWVNPAFDDSSLPAFRPSYRIPPPPPVTQPPGGSTSPSGNSYSPSSALVSPFFSTQLFSNHAPHSSSSSSSSSSSRHHRSRSVNDAPPPIAYATFGAGCVQKDVDAYTSTDRLGCYHVPFAAFPVGSAVMISGGFGFLSRQYGLSMDNLVEVELVTAQGEIKIVNEGSDPELWWALRGFGTSLGICTRYIARAFPVSVVFSGNIIYPFNRETAASCLRHFRDSIADAPRQLYANLILTAGPDSGSERGMEGMVDGKGKGAGGHGGGAVIVIQICWNGGREEGGEWVRKLCSWEGEQCLFKDVEERSFMQQQDSIANVLRGGAGRKWFIKSDLLNELPDDVITETVRMFRDVPDGCSWLFELAGGALADMTTTCVPQAARSAKFNLLALHQWPLDENAAEDERCVKTADDWITRVISPGSPGGGLPCFVNNNTPLSYVAKSFGAENWQRLVEIKRRVDPTNLFRFSLGGGIGPENDEESKGKQVVSS